MELISLKRVMLFHFFFGLYYNFSRNKYASIFLRMFSISFAIVYFVSVIFVNSDTLTFISKVLLISEYLFVVVFSSVTGQKYLFQYCRGLYAIDSNDWNKNEDYSNTYVALVVPVVFFTVLHDGCFIFMSPEPFVNTESKIRDIIFCTLVLALSVRDVTTSLPFCLLWRRIRTIRLTLENNLLIYNISTEDRVHNFKRNLLAYKNLITNFEKVSTPLKVLVSAAILFAIPRQVMLVCWYLQLLKSDYSFWTLVFGITDIIYTGLISTVLVAIPVTLISRELNSITLLVSRELKGTRIQDKDLRLAIDNIIIYITTRPFKFTIGRLFSVDLKFLLSFVELTATVVIFIVQLTNLYN